MVRMLDENLGAARKGHTRALHNEWILQSIQNSGSIMGSLLKYVNVLTGTGSHQSQRRM